MKHHIIKSLTGDVLYEGYASSFKALLEQASEDKANLKKADLRKQDLRLANLDGTDFAGASFRGTDLRGANLSECMFDECDFQLADLADACLAESSMLMCRFDGTYFNSGTIVSGTDFGGSKFTCPSIFHVRLSDAASTFEAVYSHLGEIDCPITKTPIVVSGLPYPVVFMDKHMKIGSEIRAYDEWASLDGDKVQQMYGMAARRTFEDFFLAGVFVAHALDRYTPAATIRRAA